MAGNFGKYVSHCNGIDPFVTLMGNFNWGPISGNDIVSRFLLKIQELGWLFLIFFNMGAPLQVL